MRIRLELEFFIPDDINHAGIRAFIDEAAVLLGGYGDAEDVRLVNHRVDFDYQDRYYLQVADPALVRENVERLLQRPSPPPASGELAARLQQAIRNGRITLDDPAEPIYNDEIGPGDLG